MKTHSLILSAMVLATGSAAAIVPNDTILIPEEAIVLNGDKSTTNRELLAVFYSRENMEFTDPKAPRFLLVDRNGSMIFGIGGQLYATASYDFNGSIDGPGFSTYDISVPNNAAHRQQFGANANHSSLFARLVGKNSKLGVFTVYFQANFSGDDGNYGFKLKQAYATIGHLTAGLTNSTFIDGETQAPTIDTEGPTGQISGKNILFRYTTPSYKGFSGAISIEVPKASYTLGSKTQSIAQRVPDIPAYVQYSWAGGNHVRLAAIFRDLAYRDLVSGKNILQTAWGVKLSTILTAGVFQPFGHIAYGHGIGQYVNDLDGNGYDLVETNEAGKLRAPGMLAWTVGTYVHVTDKLSFTGNYSQARVYDCSEMGGDSYKHAQYVAVNCFYELTANFKVGAEYLHGWRTNYDGSTGTANRINALLQFSF